MDFARVHHLSLFSTAGVAWYARQNLPVNRTPPTTSLVNPTAGKTLRDSVFLVATASDSFGITKVQFIVSGNDRGPQIISQGTATPFGWLGGWNTRTVPDGVYSIRSVADSPGGLTGTSRSTVVRVAN